MRFWNDAIVDKSWDVLQTLKKRYDFILIGGWAIYLYTNAMKSKDIDIIVDYDLLEKIGLENTLKKNERLKKYEIKFQEISVDIYLPYFSKIVIPPEDLMKTLAVIHGFKTPKIEELLILKQQAEMERKNSIKGLKDRVDIMCLLFSGNINFKRYNDLLEKYSLTTFKNRLKEIVSSAKDEFYYLNIKNPREIKKIKEKYKKIIENV
ncbi:MAG: hypothetical protein KJ886_03865 [Candidatus Thermoplasmatota archaeon]|nr:hypothetical protein [Candidatus Thermoplasmatota archaeon]MBU4255690.1 hypothetical protein [Candidatus Thermoplasmatota archaeon]MCG2826663.1 hypothetical protein [Thermoplasmatales archaeon]